MGIAGIVLSLISIGLIFKFKKERQVDIDLHQIELEHIRQGMNAVMDDFNNYQVSTDRKIAELEKALEIKLPNTLQMALPQDYVNYVKLTYSDSNGIEHIIYPARITSNPEKIAQTTDNTITNNYDFGGGTEIQTSDSDTWTNFQTSALTEDDHTNFDYDDDLMDYNLGQRFGLDPQFAQTNGSFYIDELRGKIHFSSNLSGLTIILKYISDSLGTDAEMQVHKFAEEALYKYIAYAVLSTRANVPINTVLRFKKEARAAKRTAKLRLSNIKLEEITQILRGKSKQIKH